VFPPEFPEDELMLDWGHIPAGASASIYLPAADADAILALADQRYDAHRLSRVDEHTLGCPTGGMTFMPIPRGADVNYAGLLTVELPPGIRKGDVHDVTVRQVTTGFARLPQVAVRPRDEAPPADADDATPAGDDDEPTEAPPAAIFTEGFSSKRANVVWRRVLGVFNVTIPVGTKAQLLGPEERLLSVLRWIQGAISLDSRWFLVFGRYVDQVADRVLDMGGDPDKVGADPNGDWQHTIKPRHDRDDEHEHAEHEHGRGEERIRVVGRIASLEYDRYGGYEAFLLDTEDGLCRFEGREAELEQLAERAWRKRTTVSVYAERHDPDRPLKLVLHAPSAALED
jgi:hypothetical protein